MSRFHVGQRVRITGSVYGHFVGMTATVISPLLNVLDIHLKPCLVHDVCVDGIGPTDINGDQIARRPEHMEPLDNDDSREVTTWDQCVWKPKSVGVGA